MAGGEVGGGEIHHRVRGFVDFTDPLQERHDAERIDIGVAVNGGPDHARRDGVDADVVGRKLRRKADGERV